jgi:hypothetical protein
MAQSRRLRSLQTHLTRSGHADAMPWICAEQLVDTQLLQASFVGLPEPLAPLLMHEAKSPFAGAESVAAGGVVVSAGGGVVAAAVGATGSTDAGCVVASGGGVAAVAFAGVVAAGGSDPHALAQTARKAKTEARFFMEPLVPHFRRARLGSARISAALRDMVAHSGGIP